MNILILIYRDKVFRKVLKRLYIYIMYYEMVFIIYLYFIDFDFEVVGGRVLVFFYESFFFVRRNVIFVLARVYF